MLDNLFLYVFCSVLVSLKDDREETGTLVSYSDQEICLNDGNEDVALPIDEVRDVELLVKLEDYHTYGKFGEIDGYQFHEEDILRKEDRRYFLFNEYDCTVACHLYTRDEDQGKTYIRDLRPHRWSHKVNYDTLQRCRHIYYYRDGRIIIGDLISYNGTRKIGQPNGEQCLLDTEGLDRILPMPNRDEYVVAVCKNGESIPGIFNGMFQNMLAIRQTQGVERVAIEDIVAFRYQGIVGPVVNAFNRHRKIFRKGSACGIGYIYKEPYLRDAADEARCGKDAKVEFEPSMIEDYPIAKDIVVLEEGISEPSVPPVNSIEPSAPVDESELYKGKGIILFLKSSEIEGGGFGYIGNNYYVESYAENLHLEKPSGFIRFTADQLAFKFDSSMIYIVEFTCVQKSSSNKTAASVTLLESYPKRDYNRVYIDDAGNVHCEEVGRSYLNISAKDTVNRRVNYEVEVTCKGGNVYQGYVSDCDESDLTLLCRNERMRISLDSIEDVRYFSMVTRSQSDLLRVSTPFPLLIHINDMDTDEDRTFFNSDLVGWVVSYRIKNNYHLDTRGLNGSVTYFKGLMGVEGRLYKTKKINAYLCALENDCCVIADRDYQANAGNHYVYPNPILMPLAVNNLQKEIDLRNFDYPTTCVRRTRGGNSQLLIENVDASALSRVQKGLLNGYITGRNGDICMIQANADARQEVYPIIYTSQSARKAQADYNNYDLRVSYALCSEHGSEGVLLFEINTSVMRPKKFEDGVMTEYGSEICKVMPRSMYSQQDSSEAHTSLVHFTSEIAARVASTVDTTRKDYPVHYVNCFKFGQEGIALWDIQEGNNKLRFGYVVTFIPVKSCGFISSEEQLREKLLSPFKRFSDDQYFPSRLVRGIRPEDIRVGQFYYKVSYLLDPYGKVASINFLQAIPKTPPTRVQQPAAISDFPRPPIAPSPAGAAPLPPQPQPKLVPQKETIPLDNLTEKHDGIFAGTNVRFGWLNTAYNRIAWVHSFYFNKKLNPGVEPPEKAICALFDPSAVTFLGLEGSRLATTKQSYFIRYVENGTKTNEVTGEVLPTIDTAYPIEVLFSFQKNRCIRADLDQENKSLVLTWNAAHQSVTAAANGMPSEARNDSTNYEPPEMCEYESLLLVMNDGRKVYGTLVAQSEESYYLKDQPALAKGDVDTLFRFGVITDFQDGVSATMNGTTDFSLSALDSAVYNILKSNAFVQPHVIYSCKDKRISTVRRTTRDEITLIGLSDGRVTEYSPSARQIVVNRDTVHCINVGTNPIVLERCKSGNIVNQEVYVRRVRHPFLDEGTDQPELMAFAVDIHCAVVELVVKYYMGLGIYKGEYSTDWSYPLIAPESSLKPKEGQRVCLDLAPNSTGNELHAFLHGQSFDEESISIEEDTASVALRDVPLSKLYLDRNALKRIHVLSSSRMDEEGMPTDVESASEALRTLNGRPNTEDTLIANYLIAERFPDVRIPQERMGRALPYDSWMTKQLRALYEYRCDQISRMNNFNCAEHSYPLLVLLGIAPRESGVVGRARTIRAYTKEDCLYRLFLMDFATEEELRRFNSPQGVRPENKNNLRAIFANSASAINMQNLVAHLLMIGRPHVDEIVRMIEANSALTQDLFAYAQRFDPTLQDSSVGLLIHALTAKYEQFRKRFIADADELADGSFSPLTGYLEELSKCFLELVCEEDKRCFEELRELSGRLSGYRLKVGFAAQESELLEIYRSLDKLESEILAHPGRESLELLATPGAQNGSLLSRLKMEAARQLNNMYQSDNAEITLEPNSTELPRGQNLVQFILSNGSAEHSYCKTITSIDVSMHSLKEGVTVMRTTAPLALAGGESEEVAVELAIPPLLSEEIVLEWSARYRCGVAFQNGKTVYDWVTKSGVSEPFQIADETSEVKNPDAVNPYRKPASGNALERESRDMFVGRKEEKKIIMDTIIHSDESGQRFVPGSTVILYGQRKCGKTSLMNILCNDIRENPVLNDRAIIITFSDILTQTCGDASSLSEFRSGLYCGILKFLRRELEANHPDVDQLLAENNLSIPRPSQFLKMSYMLQQSLFDDFFHSFEEIDQGRHTIVLIMDEFTRLCTSIADIVEAAPEGSPEKLYADIPSFIRMFSQAFHFVQLIIGHAAMMRAFGRLGTLNHTAEFAQKVELHALKPEDAQELIVAPMQRIFGYNPYRTPLGRKAIELLMDLSGCSPTFLMRLCNDVFDYYLKIPNTQLTARDIRAVVAEEMNTLTADNFDILITEDGDGAGLSVQKETYKFLFAAAKCCVLGESRTSDENRIRTELNWDEKDYIRVRELLISRHVISLAGFGHIKINNGLFVEYVRKVIN